MLGAREELAARDFVARVRGRFGARVVETTLFGSRARGEERPDSDVDVAVVVRGLTYAEGRKVAELAADVLTEHDVVISSFAVSEARMDELRKGERLIAAEIARDGIPLIPRQARRVEQRQLPLT